MSFSDYGAELRGEEPQSLPRRSGEVLRSSTLWDYTDWDGDSEKVLVAGADAAAAGARAWADWVEDTETALAQTTGLAGLRVQGLWPTDSAEMYVCVTGRGDTLASCCAEGFEAIEAGDVAMDDVEEFQQDRPREADSGALDGESDPTLLLHAGAACAACGAEPAERLDTAIWATVAAEVDFWAIDSGGPRRADGRDRLGCDAATIRLPKPEELAKAAGHEIADAAYTSRMRAFDAIFTLHRVGPGPQDFPAGEMSQARFVQAAAAGTREAMEEIAGDEMAVDSAGSTFHLTVQPVTVMTSAAFEAALTAPAAESALNRRHQVVCVVEASEPVQTDWQCFDLRYMVFDDFAGPGSFVEHSRERFGVGPDVETGGARRAVYSIGDSFSAYPEEVVAVEQQRQREVNPQPSMAEMLAELDL